MKPDLQTHGYQQSHGMSWPQGLQELVAHVAPAPPPVIMARIWDFSVSFEPKIVANAMARFW